MCGRYNFSTDSTDTKMVAIVNAMERQYPGQYKTGEIFPGDAAPAMIARQEKVIALPAIFGFPGFQDGKLLINARAETAAEKPAIREEDGRAITPWFSFTVPEVWKGRYAYRIWDDNAVDLCSKANLDHGGTLFTVIASETYRETDSFPDYGEIRYLGYFRNDETGKDNYLYYAGITDVPYDHLDPLKMVEYSAMQVTEPEVLNSIAGPHGEPLHFQGKAY